jgi:hypothetical protein
MILAQPFRRESWRVTNRHGLDDHEPALGAEASMLSHEPLLGAFSDEERRGAASPVIEVLPGAYCGCGSRLGEAFEHGLDLQMAIGLRCRVKRFNIAGEQAGRAQVALHLSNLEVR